MGTCRFLEGTLAISIQVPNMYTHSPEHQLAARWPEQACKAASSGPLLQRAAGRPVKHSFVCLGSRKGERQWSNLAVCQHGASETLLGSGCEHTGFGDAEPCQDGRTHEQQEEQEAALRLGVTAVSKALSGSCTTALNSAGFRYRHILFQSSS